MPSPAVKSVKSRAAVQTQLTVIVALLSMVMPAITILALDCFPQHLGTAASMQGFMQMLINAGVASIAVPLLHTQRHYFVFGQAAFMTLALALWYFSWRRSTTDSTAMI